MAAKSVEGAEGAMASEIRPTSVIGSALEPLPRKLCQVRPPSVDLYTPFSNAPNGLPRAAKAFWPLAGLNNTAVPVPLSTLVQVFAPSSDRQIPLSDAHNKTWLLEGLTAKAPM